MAYDFQTISFKNFGLGINAKSSPNELADGYSERLTNVDINNSSITKRKGYQGYAGWLPLRLSIRPAGSLNYSLTAMCRL